MCHPPSAKHAIRHLPSSVTSDEAAHCLFIVDFFNNYTGLISEVVFGHFLGTFLACNSSISMYSLTFPRPIPPQNLRYNPYLLALRAGAGLLNARPAKQLIYYRFIYFFIFLSPLKSA